MKAYEYQVIWLDYFNKNLTKGKGRKVSKERSVFDPKIDELAQAVKAAGYVLKETNTEVNFPRRAYVRSGYLTIEKKDSKSKVINKIADKLVQLRSRTKPK